jgi:hypothetical protein
MARIKVGLFSDSHEGNTLESIVRLFKSQNVDHTWFFGDGLYRTQAALTHLNSGSGNQVRQMARSNTPLRQEILDGYFSKEQLERVVGFFEHGRKVSDKIAKNIMDQKMAQMPNLDFILGGNHDRKAYVEAAGDAHVNGTAKEISGLNLYGCSGGGSIPKNAFMDEDLMADNSDLGVYPHKNWMQGLVSHKDIDILGMHVPYTFDDSVRKDNAGEYAREALLQRASMAETDSTINMPKAIIYGHLHDKARWSFKRIKDNDGKVVLETLVGTPGVSSQDHNLGSFSSACIAEIDTDTKQIERVHEYRMWSNFEGLRLVKHFGTHEIDYDNKKVEFTLIDETVIQDHDLGMFTDAIQLDPHSALVSQGFQSNYEGLNAWDKDALFRQNMALAKSHAEDVSHELRRTINWVKQSYLSDKSGKISDFDLRVMSETVRKLFVQEMSQKDGISFDSIENKFEQKLFENAYLSAKFGLYSSVFDQVFLVEDATVESISGKWGMERELVGHIQKKTEEINNEFCYNNLEGSDYKEMIEQVYLPGNLQFAKELKDDELQNLYTNAVSQGLLGQSVLRDVPGWFKKKSYSGNKITEDELADLFKIGRQATPREEPSIDAIGDLLNRNAQVLRDEGGDYLLTGSGKQYLTDEMKEQHDYTSKTFEEALGDDSLRIINENGKDILVDPIARIGYDLGDSLRGQPGHNPFGDL